MIYRLYMEPSDDMEGGWLTGSCRTNDYIYCRTDNKKDATEYSIDAALEEQREATEYGHPCTIYPPPTNRQYQKYFIMEKSDE